MTWVVLNVEQGYNLNLVLKRFLSPTNMLLGLDIGDKRVGIATADELGILATPYKTLSRAQGKAERDLCSLIEQHSVKKLIVGMPLGEHGEKSEQCLRVENFCRRLKKRVQIEIEFVDEYATSCEAHEKLGLSIDEERRTRKRGAIDAASAAIILQAYIDSKRQEKPER